MRKITGGMKIYSMIFLTHLNYFSVNEVPASADVKESAIRGGGGNGGEQGF